MAARKKTEAAVEVTEQAQDVDYRDAGTGQFVTEEFAEANPETTVGETYDLPDSTPDDDLRAFKEFVLQTLNRLEERITDVEVVTGVAFSGNTAAVMRDQILSSRLIVEDPTGVADNFEDDVPDYVDGVQESFNRGEGDGVPWLR